MVTTRHPHRAHRRSSNVSLLGNLIEAFTSLRVSYLLACAHRHMRHSMRYRDAIDRIHARERLRETSP